MDDKRNSETEKITCTMCGKQFDKWDMSLGDNRYDTSNQNTVCFVYSIII